jgi:hypothetical protein
MDDAVSQRLGHSTAKKVFRNLLDLSGKVEIN